MLRREASPLGHVSGRMDVLHAPIYTKGTCSLEVWRSHTRMRIFGGIVGVRSTKQSVGSLRFDRFKGRVLSREGEGARFFCRIGVVFSRLYTIHDPLHILIPKIKIIQSALGVFCRSVRCFRVQYIRKILFPAHIFCAVDMIRRGFEYF